MREANALPEILEDGTPEFVGSGYGVTEGPLWRPAGFFYFTDVRGNTLYKWSRGSGVERVRPTQGGNGTTFDVKGRLIQCEGTARRLTRTSDDGTQQVVASTSRGGRFNKPNDVVCRSDGSLFFTDPSYRTPFAEREIPLPSTPTDDWGGASVYRISPEDDSVHHVASCEYPNGLAISADERILYVANSRFSLYLHKFVLDERGDVVGRSIFADLNGPGIGHPDGVKVDRSGRVFCTGPGGGIWVFDPDGRRVGIITLPERTINFCFGDDDLKTLFACTATSVHCVRVKTPGLPHPWYASYRKGA